MNIKKLSITFLLIIGFVIIFSLNTNTSAAAVTSNTYVNSATGNDAWNGNSPVHTSGITGPKKTIKNAVNTAANYGTIKIAKGTYREYGIIIRKNMNIQGESQTNTIIDGRSSGRIFTINSALRVNICNLKFINTKTNGDGGAIASYYAYLTLNKVTFTNNKAIGTGGAIYNGHGTLNILQNTFTNNTANGGGAIANNAGKGTESVKYSLFNHNTALKINGGGAIVNYYTNLTLSQNIFQNNLAAYGSGGAVKNGGGTVTSTGDTFNSNSARGGGAILNNGNGQLTVTNDTFKGNKAIYGGAGGAIANSKAYAKIMNSNFTSNMSTNDHAGAVVSYLSYSDISNCNFYYNSAKYGGGAVHNEDFTMNLSSCTFSNNKVTNGGGGAVEQAFVSKGKLNINCCKFTNNSAATDGGAIVNYYATFSVTNSIFSNNLALSNGGAIYDGQGYSTLKGNTFSYNTANGGGAIGNNQPKKHLDYITYCKFIGNTAKVKGGGGIINYFGLLTVDYCTFQDNHSYNNAGAAIKNGAGNLSLTNSKFSNNTSDLKYDNNLGVWNYGSYNYRAQYNKTF